MSYVQLKNDLNLLTDTTLSVLNSLGLKRIRKTKPVLLQYTTRTGTKFRFRKGVWDAAAIIESWWLNEYLRGIKTLPPKATIIDIGAHIGSFSLLATTQVKNAKILAFEPEPNNFHLLEENIRINHLEKQIHAFNQAVTGEAKRKAKIYLNQINPGMNSVFLSQKAKNQSWREVSAISLKEIFEKNKITRCDFLKMDCEGCEYQIFAKTPKQILQRINHLVMEYHEGGNIYSIKEKLEQSGGWMVKAPLLRAWRL